MGLNCIILFLISISVLPCWSFTMNHCRRSLHLLTGTFPSPSQSRSVGKSYVRYAGSMSSGFEAEVPTLEGDNDVANIIPNEMRYDNITEGLRQLNSSWEFGTFPQKSKPSTKDLEDFEAARLKGANSIRTDVNWVNVLTDDEVDRAIAELSKYCSKERLERFETVLSKRTSNIRMVSK
jgi:hypothetical protein